jgi:hypothetical protein
MGEKGWAFTMMGDNQKKKKVHKTRKTRKSKK